RRQGGKMSLSFLSSHLFNGRHPERSAAESKDPRILPGAPQLLVYPILRAPDRAMGGEVRTFKVHAIKLQLEKSHIMRTIPAILALVALFVTIGDTNRALAAEKPE